jgi:hypothetical protein
MTPLTDCGSILDVFSCFGLDAHCRGSSTARWIDLWSFPSTIARRLRHVIVSHLDPIALLSVRALMQRRFDRT